MHHIFFAAMQFKNDEQHECHQHKTANSKHSSQIDAVMIPFFLHLRRITAERLPDMRQNAARHFVQCLSLHNLLTLRILEYLLMRLKKVTFATMDGRANRDLAHASDGFVRNHLLHTGELL